MRFIILTIFASLLFHSSATSLNLPLAFQAKVEAFQSAKNLTLKFDYFYDFYKQSVLAKFDNNSSVLAICFNHTVIEYTDNNCITSCYYGRETCYKNSQSCKCAVVDPWFFLYNAKQIGKCQSITGTNNGTEWKAEYLEHNFTLCESSSIPFWLKVDTPTSTVTISYSEWVSRAPPSSLFQVPSYCCNNSTYCVADPSAPFAPAKEVDLFLIINRMIAK